LKNGDPYDLRMGANVNISSVHGLRAPAFKGAYVAAKHGLEGLSKTVALEGGDRGVTSNPAEMAVYLCGPHASLANGASFVLDGGCTAR
jgi:hypothetical protein